MTSHYRKSITSNARGRDRSVVTFCNLDSKLNSFVYTDTLEATDCSFCIRAYVAFAHNNTIFKQATHLLIDRHGPGPRVSSAVECGYHTVRGNGYAFTNNIKFVTCPGCKALHSPHEENQMNTVRLDAPITRAREQKLGPVEPKAMRKAMNEAGIGMEARKEVFNRLYNDKVSGDAIKMSIHEVAVNQHADWQISVPQHDVAGTLVDLKFIPDTGKYAMSVDGRIHIINGNAEVYLKRSELQVVKSNFETAKRCNTFYLGEQCKKDQGHLYLCEFPPCRPDPEPSIEMRMKEFYANRANHMGKTVQIRHVAYDGPAKGVLTDMWQTMTSQYVHRERYTMVINGKMYAENGDHMVYIYDDEPLQCGAWYQTKYAPTKICAKPAGHTGHHL